MFKSMVRQSDFTFFLSADRTSQLEAVAGSRVTSTAEEKKKNSESGIKRGNYQNITVIEISNGCRIVNIPAY